MFEKYILKRYLWIIIIVLIGAIISIFFIGNILNNNSNKEEIFIQKNILLSESMWRVTIFPTSYYENSYNIIYGQDGKLYTQVGKRKSEEVVNGILSLSEYRSGEKCLSTVESKALEDIVNKIMCTNVDDKLPLEEMVACIDDGWVMTVEKTENMVYSCLYEDKNMEKLLNILKKCSAIKIDTNHGWGGLP